MTQLDYSLGAFIFTGIVIHENTVDKWPVYGSDYYVSSSRLPEEGQPSSTWPGATGFTKPKPPF